MFKIEVDNSDISDQIAKYRKILEQYDKGELSNACCLVALDSVAIDPLLKELEAGNTYITFGSCCCGEYPPDRHFTVEFIVQPHGFTAKRIT